MSRTYGRVARFWRSAERSSACGPTSSSTALSGTAFAVSVKRTRFR